MTPQVKAALREKLIDAQLEHYLTTKSENLGQYRVRHKCSCGEYVYVDGHVPLESNIHVQQAKHITEAALNALQSEIERVVMEAEIAENNACQQIVRRLFDTRHQLHEMQRRTASKLLTQSNQKEVK